MKKIRWRRRKEAKPSADNIAEYLWNETFSMLGDASNVLNDMELSCIVYVAIDLSIFSVKVETDPPAKDIRQSLSEKFSTFIENLDGSEIVDRRIRNYTEEIHRSGNSGEHMGIAVAIHRETGIGMKNALKIVALYHGSKMLTLELMNQTRKD